MRIEVERDFMEGGGVRSRHLERGGLGYTLWNSGRVNGFGSTNKNTPRAAGALNVTAEGGFRRGGMAVKAETPVYMPLAHLQGNERRSCPVPADSERTRRWIHGLHRRHRNHRKILKE